MSRKISETTWSAFHKALPLAQKALEKARWRSLDAECDGYQLLGFLNEFRESEYEDTLRQRLASRKSKIDEQKNDLYVSIQHLEAELDHIEGRGNERQMIFSFHTPSRRPS